MIALLHPGPTDRATDPDLPTPTTVAEAVAALRDARTVTGQYPDDLVAVLLHLVDQAAADAAALERDRYQRWFLQTAQRGTALADGVVAGLRLAATHLRDDLASRPAPDGDLP